MTLLSTNIAIPWNQNTPILSRSIGAGTFSHLGYSEGYYGLNYGKAGAIGV